MWQAMRSGGSGEVLCGFSLTFISFILGAFCLAASIVTSILMGTTYEGEGYWGLRAFVFGDVAKFHTYRAAWIVPIMAAIAAASQFLQAYTMAHIIDRSSNPVRWISHAITTSMILWYIGSMCGITDWIPLTMLVGLTFVKVLSAWHMVAAVKDGHPTGVSVGRALSICTYAFVFVILVSALYTAEDWAPSEVPDVVHVIVWVMVLLGALFYVPSELYARGRIGYAHMEWLYMEMSAAASLFFAIAVFGWGVFQTRDDDI